ncbi:hypothetical protein B0H14DRAFT_2615096 [Mycena olivaceomarginata]|nr:hypothetical protein B0H14DRAFT_2615096 [Mycena olivaceomarginata]
MSPPQTTRSEQAEKRRQHAAEYRQHPERHEKQRVLMAERRVAVKARRRRWDPPKVPKPRNPKLLDTTTGLEIGGIDPESHPTDGDIQMRNRSSPQMNNRAGSPADTPVTGKKMRRELGTVGPLTPIQVVQIKAFKLRRPSKYHEEEEPATPRPGPFLSTARWESIRWDVPVRQEFAEEALRRWRLSQMGQSSEQ